MRMFRWAFLSAAIALPSFAFAGTTGAAATPAADCCDQKACSDACSSCAGCEDCTESCEDGASCEDCGAAAGTEDEAEPVEAR